MSNNFSNAEVADFFSLLAKLLELHGENSFKVKSYANAAFTIDKLIKPLTETADEELYQIRGIGQAVAEKIRELQNTGTINILEKVIAATPPGILEIFKIKGLGSKKVATLWNELGIETIGELEYACQENRLVTLKGFGEKTQQSVLESVRYYLQHKNSFLYAEAQLIEQELQLVLEQIFGDKSIAATGALRRQEDTIEKFEFLVVATNDAFVNSISQIKNWHITEENKNEIDCIVSERYKVKIYLCTAENCIEKLFYTTANTEFLEPFNLEFPTISNAAITNELDDTSVFKRLNLPYIPPFYRNNARCLIEAQQNNLPDFIKTSSIKGIIHTHSTWSDGSYTIEQMTIAAIEKGFEYLVISDHSQSAFYANGLDEKRLAAQHKEIDHLNVKYAPFKIFKSIESDILNDGNLDYSDKILSTFDLVIASIHSNLRMNEEKAMMRLLKAIKNPRTTILGHLTGRLLLSRPSYPIQHEEIIKACVEHQVVLEINAHPRRLDMDWKFVNLAIQKGALLSINPDAHSIDGYDDVNFGVIAARKAGLTAQHNLSSFSLVDFEAFLSKQKNKGN